MNGFSVAFIPQDINNDRNSQWLTIFEEYDLNEMDSLALIMMRELGRLFYVDFQRLHNVKDDVAISRLKHLRDLGLINMIEGGENACFVPNNKKWDSLTESFNGSSISNEESERAESPGGFIDDLKLVPASLVSEVNDEDLIKLIEVAKEIQHLNQRPSYESMRSLIKKACSVRPFTSAQLAVLFKRNPNWFQEQYLKKMLLGGDLERLYPDVPSHKKQSYFVKQNTES